MMMEKNYWGVFRHLVLKKIKKFFNYNRFKNILKSSVVCAMWKETFFKNVS